jgi:hypothetical protein
MGYTHYWTNRAFSDSEWESVQRAARTIQRRAARAGVRLRGWQGSGPVAINADEVAFNGDESRGEGYESFRITREACDRDFCKTGRAPYDVAVVAMLTAAARTGALQWSSDGDESDHVDGINLARGL